MNIKKLLLAWLASFVVIFLLSGLWHMVLLGGFYETHSMELAREEINMVFVTLGGIVLAFLMAITYPIGFKGNSPVKEGFRFGALIGLIWIFPWSLIIHGIWKYPLISVLVDSGWHVIEEGLAGIAIGLVYGNAKKSE